MGIPDWNVSMVNIHLREFLWLYCPGHAGVKGNDRAAGLAGRARATLTSGLILGRSEVLRSLRHYLLSQSQGHHTIDRLEERGVESKEEALDYLPLKDERGPSSIRRPLEPFKRRHWETSERRGGEHNGGLFPAHRYRLDQN